MIEVLFHCLFKDVKKKTRKIFTQRKQHLKIKEKKMVIKMRVKTHNLKQSQIKLT